MGCGVFSDTKKEDGGNEEHLSKFVPIAHKELLNPKVELGLVLRSEGRLIILIEKKGGCMDQWSRTELPGRNGRI